MGSWWGDICCKKNLQVNEFTRRRKHSDKKHAASYPAKLRKIRVIKGRGRVLKFYYATKNHMHIYAYWRSPFPGPALFIIYFWFGEERRSLTLVLCAWSGLSHLAAFIFQWRPRKFLFTPRPNTNLKRKRRRRARWRSGGAFAWRLLWDAREMPRWFIRRRSWPNDGAEQLRIPRLSWQIAALWVLREPQWKMRNAWRAPMFNESKINANTFEREKSAPPLPPPTHQLCCVVLRCAHRGPWW